VTVVATGYEGGRLRAPRRALEEPAGEPRVERRTRPGDRDRDRERPRRSAVTEIDVPEFIPRG